MRKCKCFSWIFIFTLALFSYSLSMIAMCSLKLPSARCNGQSEDAYERKKGFKNKQNEINCY